MTTPATRAPLVSTGDAARLLGMHVRTLQRWAATNHVEPDTITPGGHRRWDVDRLAEVLRARSQRAVPARTTPPGQGRHTTGATT